jgi:hypothetical protein
MEAVLRNVGEWKTWRLRENAPPVPVYTTACPRRLVSSHLTYTYMLIYEFSVPLKEELSFNIALLMHGYFSFLYKNFSVLCWLQGTWMDKKSYILCKEFVFRVVVLVAQNVASVLARATLCRWYRYDCKDMGAAARCFSSGRLGTWKRSNIGLCLLGGRGKKSKFL